MTFSLPSRRGCALTGQRDIAYQARFAGPVSVDQTRHDVVVTRDGTPMSTTDLCINTEMVGMSGMGYTNKGRPVGPGQFQVGFQFGMPGWYTGNVVVHDHGNEISIPVKVKVAPPSH